MGVLGFGFGAFGLGQVESLVLNYSIVSSIWEIFFLFFFNNDFITKTKISLHPNAKHSKWLGEFSQNYKRNNLKKK
jgi:hypothetical protein